jgi:signal peptidase
MEPAIPTGSLVLDQRKLPDQYQVGDIVTYLDVAQRRQRTTHRITEITQKAGGAKIFQSKGDANPNGDKGYQGIGSITGKVILVIPYLGYPISWLKTPLGFLGISLVVTLFLGYILILSSLCESETVNQS